MVISPEEANRILDSNSTSEFDKLRGLPGHCLDPIDWPTACRLVQEGSFNSLGTLGRHPRDTVVYRGFRKQILSKYKNTEAYVKLTIMGYASAEADGRLVADDKAGIQDVSIFPLWRPNDFPYNMEPGIEHHNIWNPKPLSRDELEQTVRQHRQGYEYIYFVNPEGLASIPAVWHAHCFSRLRRDTEL